MQKKILTFIALAVVVVLSKPRPPPYGKTEISKIKIPGIHTPVSTCTPKTIGQTQYFEYLMNPTAIIVVGTGPAGTGKTHLACHAAMTHLKQKQVQKLVITRPMISVDDEQMGFLPGTIQQKMDPWTRPIFDIMKELFTPKQIQTMIDNEIIEISPLAYMRGRTFKNTYIVADEMQNSSPNQMLMLMTRVGENSKMAITGDTQQSDRMYENGLHDLIQRISAKNNKSKNMKNKEKTESQIQHVELEASDIQRSSVIAEILYMYSINK